MEENMKENTTAVLTNGLVLYETFLNLDIPELLKVRFVNKRWNFSATGQTRRKFWSEKKFLRLSDKNSLERFANTYSSAQTKIVHTCYSLSNHDIWKKNSSDSNTKNYQEILLNAFLPTVQGKIKSVTVDLEFSTPTILDNFLEKISCSLRELVISSTPRSATAENFNEAFESWQTNENSKFHLNKLTHLCMSGGFDEANNDYQIGMLNIVLQRIPPNKVIKIDLVQWTEIPKTVVILERYNQINNLKTLKAKVLPQDIELLKATKCKFHELNIGPPELGTMDNNGLNLTEAISALLGGQGSCLQNLQWASDFCYRFPIGGLPSLKKLKLFWQTDSELDIAWTAEQELWNQTHKIICYGRLFPKLENLCLQSVAGHSGSPDPPEELCRWVLDAAQSCCDSLKTLSLAYKFLDATIINTMAKVFPKLCSLELCNFERNEGTKLLFNSLWNKFSSSNLKELTLNFSEFGSSTEISEFEIDSLFSGITENELAKLVENAENGKFVLDFEAAQGILNLKALNTLVIFGYVEQEYRLQSFTALNVFACMKNLEKLSINDNMHKFSPDVIEYLPSKFRFNQ